MQDRAVQLTAIIIGAGNRGTTYAEYSKYYPEKFQVVGVADPRCDAREKFRKEFQVVEDKVFSDWKDACVLEKFADIAIIATPDKLHKDPAVAFASKGYHILLEKPMATTKEDCIEIVNTCKKHHAMLAVCHVLRYLPQARKIKELIDSGVIGDVMNIQHIEPVGFWHFAHSYVRGNWRNEKDSSFSLLAKSCHDIDLIQYWMGDKKCTSVSSFGSLMHFSKTNKPRGAGFRCLDCTVEENCQFSAKKIYLNKVKMGHTGWPNNVLTKSIPDIESITDALTTGPYGRCVYECDNDVMSNQVVNMQFGEEGPTASMSMVACTEKTGIRQVKVSGTKGELQCDFDSGVHHYDFLTRTRQMYVPALIPSLMMKGHGGADFQLLNTFLDAVSTNDPSKILSGPEETLRSHLLVFDAERSRLEGTVVKHERERVKRGEKRHRLQNEVVVKRSKIVFQ